MQDNCVAMLLQEWMEDLTITQHDLNDTDLLSDEILWWLRFVSLPGALYNTKLVCSLAAGTSLCIDLGLLNTDTTSWKQTYLLRRLTVFVFPCPQDDDVSQPLKE